jgi:hypothetical protein
MTSQLSKPETAHELKTWPEYFEAISTGEKTFDLRKDDRGFKVGDTLRLREWSPVSKEYSGRELTRRIAYILPHLPTAGCAATFGLQAGHAILALGVIHAQQTPSREEFEIVRKASRLFQEASENWMARALTAEAAMPPQLLVVAERLVQWADQACPDDEEAIRYMNGESDVYPSNGWEDIEAIANQARSALSLTSVPPQDAPAQTTSSGLRDRGERETILMYEDALGRIITEDREEHTNADGPCAKIAREAIAKSAAVPPHDNSVPAASRVSVDATARPPASAAMGLSAGAETPHERTEPTTAEAAMNMHNAAIDIVLFCASLPNDQERYHAVYSKLVELRIPSGWKIVPLLPTKEMMDEVCNGEAPFDYRTIDDIYQTMIERAPQPPIHSQEATTEINEETLADLICDAEERLGPGCDEQAIAQAILAKYDVRAKR